MNIEQTEKLIHLLKRNGLSHYKTEKLELSFFYYADSEQSDKSHMKTEINSTQQETSEKLSSEKANMGDPIPHHENEVMNMLRMNDNDLVDKLFPDYSQDHHHMTERD